VGQQTSLGLYLAMSINPNTAFNLSAFYNPSTQQVTEVDYALNVRCDCATFGFVYRTFPPNPTANNFMLMVQLNSFGPNTTF
jgi:hypothetical protein